MPSRLDLAEPIAMTRTLALMVLLFPALIGCLQGSRAHELAALLKVAPALMQAAPSSGPLAQAQWPAELKALDPKRVYATQDGLYVVTSDFFVEEEGLFLPRSPRFSEASGGDPEFKRLVDGLYSYKRKG